MTTPITSLQIVAGKLLSKLLQLTILLLISLPLLAIVRVFGGVPWSYVIAGGCITLTASLLAGAIAMFYSTIFRRAYASILMTLATGFVFYALLPWVFGMIIAILAMASSMGSGDTSLMEGILTVLLHTNPFAAMFVCTMEIMQPGGMAGAPFSFYWPVHCLVMLGFTGVMLIPCVSLVRRAQRRSIGGKLSTQETNARPAPASPPTPATRLTVPRSGIGRTRPADGPPPPPGQAAMAAAVPVAPARKPPSVPRTAHPGRTATSIRRITGSPLVWKKLRTPMLPGNVIRIVAVTVVLVLTLKTYLLCALAEVLDEAFVHGVYAVVFLLMGMTTTAVFAATSIASEKESRTLPILLTTPIGDWHVVGASVVEVLRRTLPVWAILFIHLLVFTIVGFIHPIAMVHLGMLVAGVFAFLTGAGLYFSCRFKRTTPAVVMNMGLALALWAVLPVVVGMVVFSLFGRLTDAPELLACSNPVVQGWCVTYGAGDYDTLMDPGLSYDWPLGMTGAGDTTVVMLVSMLLYAAVGYLFLWRAKSRLRRNLF